MRLGIMTVAVLMAASIAAAQAPADVGSAGPNAAQHLERLSILLDLTDTQKLQVQQVLEEQHAKMKALHQQMKASGQRPSFEQMRTAREQQHQQTLAAMKPLLTSEQYRKFEVLSQEHGPRGWHHPAAAPPATPN